MIGKLSKSLGELNLYSYCANNPIMYTDESGEGIVLSIVLGLLISGVLSGGMAMMGKAESESWGGAFLGGFINGVFGAAGLAAGLAIGPTGILLAAIGGFGGGYLGSLVSQQISYGSVRHDLALINGGISALFNTIAFIGLQMSDIVSGANWGARFVDAVGPSMLFTAVSVYLGTVGSPNPHTQRDRTSTFKKLYMVRYR